MHASSELSSLWIIILIFIIIGTWEADGFAKLGDFHCVPGTDQVKETKNDDNDEKIKETTLMLMIL